MAKKPEPTKTPTWTIYEIAAKQLRLGTADAPDEMAAIENASRSRRRTGAEDFRRRHRMKACACASCGVSFQSARRDTIYCSQVCRQRAHRVARRKRA